VIVADRRRLVRAGLKALLESKSDIRVCGEAGNATELVAAVKHARAEVLLLEHTLPPYGAEGALKSSPIPRMRRDPCSIAEQVARPSCCGRSSWEHRASSGTIPARTVGQGGSTPWLPATVAEPPGHRPPARRAARPGEPRGSRQLDRAPAHRPRARNHRRGLLRGPEPRHRGQAGHQRGRPSRTISRSCSRSLACRIASSCRSTRSNTISSQQEPAAASPPAGLLVRKY